ncbi:TPR-like protein [Purpureocillium lavendulum]|uniref:TPR-like protein n=1 Tax=Purpureocillium lavendulum TaxID=1247861 RepID=A0AB34FKA5_9HYPO|nr:TPR-like protein [Purpureocillium lavendulum]
MAPSDPVVVGRERKLRSIVGMTPLEHLPSRPNTDTALVMTEFATDLQSKVEENNEDAAVQAVTADLSHNIQTIQGFSRQPPPTIPRRTAKDLERRGRELWNLCIRVRRQLADHSPPTSPRIMLLVRARVFAFLILEAGRQAAARWKQRPDAGSEAAYLLKLALTLARICIGDENLDSARLALQRAAEYVDQLKAGPPESGSSDTTVLRTKLEAEYLTMRMTLAKDCFDVAEHMYSKANPLLQTLDVSSAESMSNMIYHIASNLSAKNNFNLASKWFKRAHDVLHSQNLEKLSMHGLELRLAISHGRVKALLGIGSPECLEEASNLVAYVEAQIGDKPVVLHWRLEILQTTSREAFDVEAYASELCEKSSRLACGLLEELTRHHVLQSENKDWINKVVVRRTMMTTMEPTSTESLGNLRSYFDQVRDALSEPIGSAPAGAAQSLLWKKMESSFAKERFAAADAWCEVSLHPIFSGCDEFNKAKFGRKRIQCAIRLNDPGRARAAFQSMADGPRDEPLTSYLMFKVALLSWDHELGCQCVERLSRGSDAERTRDILYACVREAQQVGDKICTLAALKSVAHSWTRGKSLSSNYPAVLRCTIRLIRMVEEETDAGNCQGHKAEFAEDLCGIFEKAADLAKQGPTDDQGKKIFTIPELHWFRKNSYNIGATECDKWEPQCIVRVFAACVTLIGYYPEDVPLADAAELTLMAMRCHFVIAAALVALARAEDKVDEQLQRYLETRRHVAAFDAFSQRDVGPQDKALRVDLSAKWATLSVFDFESTVALKAWDDLNTIVRKAKTCRDEVVYKAMGDCLLRSHPPGRDIVLYAAMRLIVNEIFELENFDGPRLAKYMRCIFQAVLPLDDGLALQLLDQALQLAREAAQMLTPFGALELEWLVASSFNHAVDQFARGDEAGCHRWALKAMDLAGQVDDNGALAAALHDRFARMRFEDGGLNAR